MWLIEDCETYCNKVPNDVPNWNKNQLQTKGDKTKLKKIKIIKLIS